MPRCEFCKRAKVTYRQDETKKKQIYCNLFRCEVKKRETNCKGYLEGRSNVVTEEKQEQQQEQQQ